METRFDSFREFYPYYLGEHANRICRRLHFAGSTLIVLIVLATIFGALRPLWLFTLPLVGYGFAWLGHFGFEKNRPATFKHPLYSLAGDWVMFKDMLIGKIAF